MLKKEKIAAALLALFLGPFGVHRFYLGQVGRGIVYLIFFWFPLIWIISFIDFIIFISMPQDDFDRKYNTQLYERRSWAEQPMQQQQYQQRPQPYQQQRQQQQQPRDEHQLMLQQVMAIRADILKTIENSHEYENDIILDIKMMMDNYIEQTKELIDRDRKLKQTVDGMPMNNVNDTIYDLRSKLTQTVNPSLKQEYEKSIERYTKHRKSLQDFKDQREVIRLRLDSTIMSLRQIKYDLIKMESLASDEKRKHVMKSFEEKSDDLSAYLKILKQSYDETDFS